MAEIDKPTRKVRSERRDARRPTVKELETIRSCTMLGMSTLALADELGMEKCRFDRWVLKFLVVREALREGRARRRRRAYACFYNQAFPVGEDGRPTGQGDPSLMIFWMKTREKWREAPRQIELGGTDEPPTIVFKTREQIIENEDD